MQSGAECKLPEEFSCPISYKIMLDPYVTPTGRSLEKAKIIQWVKENHKDPISQSAISEKDLVPNHALKLAIDDFKKMDEQSLPLLQIYHQRGSDKIEELKNYLTEINKHIAAEEKGIVAEFVVNHAITLWPFPVICPRTGTLITDPIIEADGETYQKPAESKQQHVPNLNLKNSLNLFPINIDNKLNYHIKKIKRLIKQTSEANKKFSDFQLARLQARQAELERETQQLQRQLAEIARLNQKKKRQKYLLGATAAVAAGYGLMLAYDYFYGEENSNVLVNSNDHWFGSALLKPIVTTVTAVKSLLPNIITGDMTPEEKDHQQNLIDCKSNNDSDYCGKAITHALKMGRNDLLKELYQSIDPKYFIKAIDRTITTRNFHDFLLLQLDPKILEKTDRALFILTSNEHSILLLDDLLKQGYHIDRTPHSETRLMTALRNNEFLLAEALIDRDASLAPRSNGLAPLHIAISHQHIEIVKKIIVRNQALAKAVIAATSKSESVIRNIESVEMLNLLLSTQVLSVKDLDEHDTLFTTFSNLKFATFEFLVSQGVSVERFVETLEKAIDYSWPLYYPKLLKLFEKNLVSNERNIAQKVLVKAFEEPNTISLIELLIAKGTKLPDSFNLKAAINYQISTSFSQFSLRMLKALLKAAADRQDFDNTIKEISPQTVRYAQPRALAMLINAGYQLDMKAWETPPQDKILKALEELNKLEKLVIKNKIDQRTKGLQGTLLFAADQGFKDVVKTILKSNLMDYETIKKAALLAHKHNHSKTYISIYNLLRNQLRTLSAAVTPPHYRFYQPAARTENSAPKESQRILRRGR